MIQTFLGKTILHSNLAIIARCSAVSQLTYRSGRRKGTGYRHSAQERSSRDARWQSPFDLAEVRLHAVLSGHSGYESRGSFLVIALVSSGSNWRPSNRTSITTSIASPPVSSIFPSASPFAVLVFLVILLPAKRGEVIGNGLIDELLFVFHFGI